MNEALKEAQAVLLDLELSLQKERDCWEIMQQNNPGFEQLSDDHWQQKQARSWLHGATDLQESNELEKWLYYFPEESKIALSLAVTHYCEWKEFVEDGGKNGENTYLDFQPNDLIEPENNELLLEYIQRLADLIEEKGRGNKKESRALSSFLDYLRVYYKQEEIAFIEHIFPHKNDLLCGKIIRLIRPQSYPVSQEIAASIIKGFAHKCIHGRPDAQLKVAEALGLSLLCLTASRIRLPRTLEMVHRISSDDLLLDGIYPILFVPSIFGKQEIRISKRWAHFLQVLTKIPANNSRKTILQSSLHDLRRPLNDVISKIDFPGSLGDITFLTFLSSPHHFGKQIRCNPKVKHNQ